MWRERPYFDDLMAPGADVRRRHPGARSIMIVVSDEEPLPGDVFAIGGRRVTVFERARLVHVTGPAPVPPHYAVAVDAARDDADLLGRRLARFEILRGGEPI